VPRFAKKTARIPESLRIAADLQLRMLLMARTKDPTPPAHLTAASRRWWASVVAGYELDEHHRHLLTLAAEALDRSAQARRVLAKQGITTVDRYGQVRPHPATQIERDSAIRFARLLRELDLDGEPMPDPRQPRRGGRY
jgi:phage terminase small subunit